MKLFADFVCALRTAATNKVNSFYARRNNKVVSLCLALEELGYIAGFTLVGQHRVCVHLRFNKNKSIIRYLSLYSKPSSKIYLNRKYVTGIGIGSFMKNNSFTLFFTNRGRPLLTDVELTMLNIGGVPAITIG